MMISALLQKLETATHPVSVVMSKGPTHKVVLLALKKGMPLPNHITALPAQLTVLKGSILYTQGQEEKILQALEDTAIPAGAVHALRCLEDAVCLLVQGINN